MEIKFEQQGLLYVAEFEVAQDCNLHIERESRGAFTIAQRGTKQGKYAYITEENYDDRTIIDVDMLGNIYPKYIKITSASRPTYAEVNFAEEGGGSSEGGVKYTYYDITSLSDENKSIMVMCAYLVKGSTIFFASEYFDSNTEDIPTAVSVDKSLKLYIDDDLVTVEDLLIYIPNTLHEITEEEFYNLKI